MAVVGDYGTEYPNRDKGNAQSPQSMPLSPFPSHDDEGQIDQATTGPDGSEVFISHGQQSNEGHHRDDVRENDEEYGP